MPFLSLARLPTLVLALILFYGAFSRLTHGLYTTQFYKYQIERQPDDGSPASILPVVMDGVLGAMLMFAQQRDQARAALGFIAMQGIGLKMQVQAGKDWTGDAMMLILGAIVASRGTVF